MKGYIISYNEKNKKTNVLVNFYLFGRLTNIKSKKSTNYYYYPGLLENTQYYKISNGCYFTKDLIDDYNGFLRILPATIQIDDKDMIVAKEYWRAYIEKNKINVKNFGE